MEKKRVFNLVILDASGSMSSIYQQALTGVNETIATIRLAQEQHAELEQYLTLCSFSAGEQFLDVVFDALPIGAVRNITKEDYPLRGCTALYDAMGDMISSLQQKISHDDLVLVTIITDGYENASVRWSGRQIKSLVEELRQMGWTFTYIGANQDVEAVASQLGVRNTLAFQADAKGTATMFAKERKARLRHTRLMMSFLSNDMECCIEPTDYFKEED